MRFELRSLMAVLTLLTIVIAFYTNHLRRLEIEKRLAEPLEQAARRGDTLEVRRLLDQGANVNSVTNGRFNWTPLMHAAFNGHSETVELLLERHANVNHRCRDYFTAVALAADGNHWLIWEQLIYYGADNESIVGMQHRQK